MLVTVDPLVLVVPSAAAAPGAPSLPLLPTGTAAVLTDGRVRFGDGADAPVLGVRAPLDGRMAVDPVTGALALPAAATRRSGGVLGDDVESTAVVVVDVEGIVRTIDAEPDEVFEVLGPAWVDLGSDGASEVALVASHPDTGARVVVVRTDGTRLEGPSAGPGRWVHLVGASFLGPDRRWSWRRPAPRPFACGSPPPASETPPDLLPLNGRHPSRRGHTRCWWADASCDLDEVGPVVVGGGIGSSWQPLEVHAGDATWAECRTGLVVVEDDPVPWCRSLSSAGES